MNIYILSRSGALYSTSRLAEAAEKRNHKVEVIDHTLCNLVIDNSKSKIYYYGEELEKPDFVIPRIGASVTYYGTCVVRQFEAMGVEVLNSSDSILRSRDKVIAQQVLVKNGISLPKASFTNFSNDVEEMIESIGGTPCVIKLNEGTQGIGVLLAENESAAESSIETFNQLKARVIVQEFIKESKGEDIRVIVVGSKVVATMRRKAPKGEFRSNIHRGAIGMSVTITSEEERLAIEACSALGLNVAGVDILRSFRGPLVLEVNSTPGLEGVENATGVEVAEEIIKYVEKSYANL